MADNTASAAELNLLRFINWTLAAIVAALAVIALIVNVAWNYFAGPPIDDWWAFFRECLFAFKTTRVLATPTILMTLFGCIVVGFATVEMRGARRWLVRGMGVAVFGAMGYGVGWLFVWFLLLLQSLGVPTWLINVR